MNQCNFVGRMTRDAEDIGGSSTGIRFSVAVEDYNSSTKARETTFVDCVAFGNVVNVIKDYAGKGREVRVTGKLKRRKYTPTKGVHAGHEVEQTSIFVDDFELLAGKASTQGGSGGSGGGGSNGDDDSALW